MKIKRKFALYNILIFLTPIVLIGVISVGFFADFVMRYPIQDIPFGRGMLLNPAVFTEAMRSFFRDNPAAWQASLIWAGLCVLILVVTTVLFTAHMARTITEPIADLTDAAEKIRDGHMDFEVLGSSYAEINTLCTEFDHMRRALRMAGQKEAALKKERSMMLANLSHDLKTPVTTIRGYVDGIRDGVADTPDKVGQYLDTIYAKAALLDELVNNLSEFSRLELDKQEFSFAEGELNRFITEVISEYRLDLEKNDMTLVMELHQTALPVRIDYEKMGRVFANLIDNAIKYKRPGKGTLRISTYLQETGAYAQITDDGVGIAPDKLETVFDSFYRIDPARTPKIQGSGLGLGIAREIVLRHGGKIWLKSAGEQKGTTAIIYLPLAEDKNKAQRTK